MGVYERYINSGATTTKGGVYARTMRGLGVPVKPEEDDEGIFTDKSINPADWAAAGWETAELTLSDSYRRMRDAASTAADSHKSLLDKGVDVGEAGIGVVNAIFSPISIGINTLAKVPVVGYGFDILNKVFETISTVGAKGADKVIDTLPVSDETKEKVRPLAEEVGALTAQILAAKGAQLAFRKAPTKPGAKPTTETLHSQLSSKTEQIVELVRKDMQKTPAEKHIAYAKKMGYEPYQPTETLPTIKATGAKPKLAPPVLPVISAGKGAKPKPVKLGKDITLVPETPSTYTRIMESRPSEPINVEVPKTQTSEVLLAEARKYKTAEEFVKVTNPIDTPNVYIHQTDGKITGKFNTKEVWVAPDDTAFYGKNSVKVYAESKKPFDLNVRENQALYDRLGGEVNPKTFDELRRQGFDSVIETNGDRAFLYPDRVSKLTDIWKQANKGSKVDPLVAEAEPTLAPERTSSTPKPPNRTGISETSLKVQERAGERGLDIPAEMLSKIDPYSGALEAERFARFAKENPEAAWAAYDRVVNTLADSPQSGVMQWGLYKKAMAEGDIGAVLRLAKSPIGTEFGRGLQSFNRANDLDVYVVRTIQDINRAGSRGIDIVKEAEKIKFEAEKPTPTDWQKFLEDLPPEC